MKILITGACGFVGASLAATLIKHNSGLQIVGLDNLLRPGSETNRSVLRRLGVRFFHGDIRMPSDLEAIGPVDWVIDAAAHPSVLAGLDGRSSPRQLAEHNLLGTINTLEHCRRHKAGFTLLSTSRVYSIEDLAALPVTEKNGAFHIAPAGWSAPGVTASGIDETFPTREPVSLYGATKLASEVMAREYGLAFSFPVWINRCGVLAGAGQFGTAEQGIFSYWLHAHAARLPLRYIGFGGYGHQVRDALHPEDLAELVWTQMNQTPPPRATFHASGGLLNSMSLSQLTYWCDQRFGTHTPQPDDRPRPFDIPWLVMDHRSTIAHLGWSPKRSLTSILEEIAEHVASHPDWLERTGAI
jgi:CDP-paratose 2-epimerase